MPRLAGDLQPAEWIDIMNSLRDVTKGKKPFEHPGSPAFRPGMKYEMTEHEAEFEATQRTEMTKTAFRRGVLWGVTPYFAFQVPNIRTSFMFRNQKSPLVYMLLMGSIGYLRGALENAEKFSQGRFQLDSPMGREGRWQLHKKDPQHPWLIGFENEFQNNRYDPRMPERGGPPRGRGGGHNNNYGNDDGYDDGGYHNQTNSNYNQNQEQKPGDVDSFSVDSWFHGTEGGTIPQGGGEDPHILDERQRQSQNEGPPKPRTYTKSKYDIDAAPPSEPRDRYANLDRNASRYGSTSYERPGHDSRGDGGYRGQQPKKEDYGYTDTSGYAKRSDYNKNIENEFVGLENQSARGRGRDEWV